MDQPLISVIVPAYNAEKWIRDCCRSVFDQTYSNWELIVVDDGSRDNTLQIARQEANRKENVKVIHSENGGVCRARNLGLDAAQGELITFLDADDLLLPQALEKLYELLTEENCDISIGWKINMTGDGQVLGCPYQAERAVWHNLQALEHSLRDHPATYSVWGKLYKRQIVEDVRFVEGRKVHEDSFYLFQCLLRQPSVAVANFCVLNYRISTNSASRAPVSEKLFDILYFAQRKEEAVRQKYPQMLELARNMQVKAHMALLHNLCNTFDRQYRLREKTSLRYVLENRSCFVCATDADRKWFWILTHHLYHPYKLFLNVRNRIRTMLHV